MYCSAARTSPVMELMRPVPSALLSRSSDSSCSIDSSSECIALSPRKKIKKTRPNRNTVPARTRLLRLRSIVLPSLLNGDGPVVHQADVDVGTRFVAGGVEGDRASHAFERRRGGSYRCDRGADRLTLGARAGDDGAQQIYGVVGRGRRLTRRTARGIPARIVGEEFLVRRGRDRREIRRRVVG